MRENSTNVREDFKVTIIDLQVSPPCTIAAMSNSIAIF